MFIRSLNAVNAELPADKTVHVILDNYATHKPPKVRAWLAQHPRWTFHFVPTSCSWLDAVEGFFAKLMRPVRGRVYAARRLRVNIEILEEMAEQMTPELGCLSVIESTDEMAGSVTAFTSQGLRYL